MTICWKWDNCTGIVTQQFNYFKYLSNVFARFTNAKAAHLRWQTIACMHEQYLKAVLHQGMCSVKKIRREYVHSA